MGESNLISVVVPACNEEGNIHELYQRVCDVCSEADIRFELIVVDDGSTDGTWGIVSSLSQQDDRVRSVRLSRNFGHQVAVSAGLDHAGGSAVIVMDGDLQHPPEVIPEMVAKWREGYEVVYMIRESTVGASAFKRLSASLYYWLLNAVSDVPIVANAADFRLMDRRVVDVIIAMPERGRLLRGLVSWVGFRQTGIPFVADRRHHGTTKYSLRRMVRLSLDGLTAFSVYPLRFAAYMGVLAALTPLPYGAWGIYAALIRKSTVPGWTSLLVAVLFLGGIQLIAIGVIGEYLCRIYEEVKARPLYVRQDIVGFTDARHDGPKPIPHDFAPSAVRDRTTTIKSTH